MNPIQEWIEANLPVSRQRRTYDTLLKCKCPICGDYQKKDRKNRMRAAFIIKEDCIHYNCFNDERCSRKITFNNLAYITSRFKGISFDAAKTMLGSLSKHFMDMPPESTKSIVTHSITSIDVPGSSIDLNGLKWLVSRGIDNANIVKRFKKKWSTLYYPLTYRNQVFGYKEIGIKKKWYKTETGGNDINTLLIGIDDIKPCTKLLVVVESILDALLITQDSDHAIVGVSMDGAVMNQHRIDLLESLGIDYTINPDNDKTGMHLIENLRNNHPSMKGVLFPSGYKDYGEYRKTHGSIASLAYINKNLCEIVNPKIELMRI